MSTKRQRPSEAQLKAMGAACAAEYVARYCPHAVDNAIAASNRAGRRIGAKEARLIHALLKGRG
jgi:hypothetical protein